MSSNAKKSRDEWETKLIACKETLVQVSQATPLLKRSVTKKLAELTSIWEKLQASHAGFCRHAGVGISSTESREYLRDMGKVKEEGDLAAETALGEEDTDEVTVRRLKRAINTLQSEVGFAIPAIEGLADEDGSLNREAYQQALNLLEGAEDKMGRYVEMSGEAEDLMETGPADALGKKTSELHKVHGTKLMELRGKIAKKAPVVKEQKPEVKAEQSTGDGPIRAMKKEPVKIKPIDCPTWDGKYRSFPRFKKLWDENINPRHEDSALHLMLVQSLPKFVLDNISTLTDSADDIWRYLEEKYGKPEVVAKEVMSELMGLDHKKLGSKFMGKFCTLLLDTHSLLASMGEEDWLVSSRSVSELEAKLPRDEQIEWVKVMGTIGGDTKFEKFRTFLQQRKSVLELLDTMGYKAGRNETKCEYCSRPGHVEGDCFTKHGYPESSGGRGFKSPGGCAICGKPDHWKNECPDKGTRKDRGNWKPGTGSNHFGKGSGNSGGWIVEVVVQVMAKQLLKLAATPSDHRSVLGAGMPQG